MTDWQSVKHKIILKFYLQPIIEMKWMGIFNGSLIWYYEVSVGLQDCHKEGVKAAEDGQELDVK